jgi:hypothetical protein
MGFTARVDVAVGRCCVGGNVAWNLLLPSGATRTLENAAISRLANRLVAVDHGETWRKLEGLVCRLQPGTNRQQSSNPSY